MKYYVIYQNTIKGVLYIENTDKYGFPSTPDINKAYKYSEEEANAQLKICNKVCMEQGIALCMKKEV